MGVKKESGGEEKREDFRNESACKGPRRTKGGPDASFWSIKSFYKNGLIACLFVKITFRNFGHHHHDLNSFGNEKGG